MENLENISALTDHPHYIFHCRCSICGRDAVVHETETPDRLKFAHCERCGFFRQWPYSDDRLIASPAYLDSLAIRRNDRAFYCCVSLNHVAEVSVYLKTIFMGLLPLGKIELHATICNEPPNWADEATFHRSTQTTYTLGCLVGLVTRVGICIEVLQETKGVVVLTGHKPLVV